MIIFPKEANYYYSKKIAQENLKLLEKTLRKLGNFDKGNPIEITEYRNGDNCWDIIYSVKDLDDTTFEFYNYGLDSRNNKISSLNRFCQNSHLTMIKSNSNLVYKYDFSKMKYSDFKQILRVIEISSSLTDNRKISLQREKYCPLKIKIEENGKKYILFYDKYRKLDLDEALLKDFENLSSRLSNLKELNLEQILTVIKYLNELRAIYIYIEDQEKSNVKFNNGIITRYEINDKDKKIIVDFSTEVTRTIERKIDTTKIENTKTISTENYEILKSDYKRLFKQL